MRECAVLMSTYNGAKYISSQIESIMFQENVNLDLFIKDDGSTDSTLCIIDKFCKLHKNISIISTDEKGVGKSFISLLVNCGEYDYYAFSDQDDVWDKDKLYCAIEYLKEHDENLPALYCCNQRCVDEEMNYISNRFQNKFTPPVLMDSVFGNYFAGCTMVLNRQLREIICCRLPNRAFFEYRIHDAWIACVSQAVGRLVYDDRPHMNFRRTGDNYSDEFVPGSKNHFIRRNINKIRRAKRRGISRNGIKLTALALLNDYSDFLDCNQKKKLIVLAEYDQSVTKKIRLLKSGLIRSHCKGNELITCIKIIAGIL